jgi:hypothetical protein
MIKRILFALTLLATPASAQTYPTPTFGSVTTSKTGGTSGNVSYVGALTGTYTVSGPPTNYAEVNSNGSMNWPITSISGGCCRLHYWSDTVNVTGNQNFGTNVIEANFFNFITSGTGTLTGEAFNVVHPYSYIAPGITLSGYAENFESSTQNDGTISGVMLGNLNIFSNGASATVGTYSGFKTSATNSNTTAGSFSNYTGFECAGFSGAGSVPTYNWCFVNRDSTASLVTTGGMVIGALQSADSAGTLLIRAPNTSGSTYPLFIKNSAGTNLFGISASGYMNLYAGDITINNGAISALYFKVGSTLGSNCSAGTVNTTTMVVQYGIVTHC